MPGIVRSCKPYGCFVELTPNLSGLADSREDIPEGRLVSVYIRSIQPQTGKIKLQMVQELGQPDFPHAAALSNHRRQRQRLALSPLISSQ